ncbi:MAG: ribonuclease H-like domain-containing protein [Nitrospirota bacterium]|nr:MAG: ribonuclease H-like domain-containing protein [Nitrospirota bacterium]
MKVVLDIETVQAPREEWARLIGLGSDSDDSLSEEAASDLFTHAQTQERQKKENELYERSSFDGTFSRIVCIGMLIFSDSMGPQGNVAWYGTNEKELLRRFWARIADLRPTLFITHNGLGFDIPFIKKRSIIHQIKPTLEINLARFRTEPVYDTMAIWSNWDTRGWVKLDVLARALNVETKSGSGAQVAEMWAAGQGEAIAEYCLQDTYVTYACYQRMTFHHPQPSQEILKHMNLLHVE